MIRAFKSELDADFTYQLIYVLVCHSSTQINSDPVL